MTLRDRSDLIWVTWLLACFSSFAAIESVAYRTERPGTLSRSLCRWFGFHPRCRRRHLSAVMFAGAWLAMWIHLETLPQEKHVR